MSRGPLGSTAFQSSSRVDQREAAPYQRGEAAAKPRSLSESVLGALNSLHLARFGSRPCPLVGYDLLTALESPSMVRHPTKPSDPPRRARRAERMDGAPARAVRSATRVNCMVIAIVVVACSDPPAKPPSLIERRSKAQTADRTLEGQTAILAPSTPPDRAAALCEELLPSLDRNHRARCAGIQLELAKVALAAGDTTRAGTLLAHSEMNGGPLLEIRALRKKSVSFGPLRLNLSQRRRRVSGRARFTGRRRCTRQIVRPRWRRWGVLPAEPVQQHDELALHAP